MLYLIIYVQVLFKGKCYTKLKIVASHDDVYGLSKNLEHSLTKISGKNSVKLVFGDTHYASIKTEFVNS